MEPVAFVIGKIKELATSGQDFVGGLFHRHENSTRRNPIEILKRLRQEAFSDLTSLRDTQDKVERMLSFYKTSKGSPFAEANIHLRGEVDVLGAILSLDDVDLQHHDTLIRAGIQNGIKSRFTFETTIREKDALLAEFVARNFMANIKLHMVEILYFFPSNSQSNSQLKKLK